MPATPVTVFRKNPADPKGRYQEFTVDIQPTQTVLDALHTILYEQDPTLSFRRSCRSAICGSCAMRINGRARLACNTQALNLFRRDGHILVEPLKNLAVVKDLAVDMRGFWRSIRAVRPSLVERQGEVPQTHYAIPGKRFNPLKIVSDCIMCGACLSDCTVREVHPGFLGPAALAKAFRFVGDPRDGATRSRLALYSEPNGIWDCDTCLMCNEVCPMLVKPLDAILLMREAAIENGFVKGMGPKHALAFYETVERTGKLHETSTAIHSLGARFFSPGNLALTARTVLRGKRPRLLAPKPKGLAEVRKLVASVHRERYRTVP